MDRVAVVVLNLIQFQSIRYGLDGLTKKDIPFDIFVPKVTKKNDFFSMFEETTKKIIELGYDVNRTSNPKMTYKILLEPYSIKGFLKINSVYKLKYKYGVSAKPSIVYTPHMCFGYDAILCNNEYEKDVLNVYSDTFNIGNLKFANKKHLQKSNSKQKTKTILYLPTYGDFTSIDEIVEVLKTIKVNYNILIKIHHGTSFLKSEVEHMEKLREFVDEIYDQNTELVDLLEKSDIVLSDNSGSIFEAIMAEIPVAVYGERKNLKLGSLEALQNTLINDGIIPFTDKAMEIDKILNKAISDEIITKQLELKKKLFTVGQTDMVNNFIEIIEHFLNLNSISDKKRLRDFFIEEYNSLLDLNIENNLKINSYILQIDELIKSNHIQEINYNQTIANLELELNLKSDKLNHTIVDLEEFKKMTFFEFSKYKFNLWRRKK